MVRSAFTTETITNYIHSLAPAHNNSVGLLFGQSGLGKDYIVHACITPSSRGEDEEQSPKNKSKKNITELDEKWIGEHARHASRMLSGGMHVLGIFVISEENVLSPFHVKLKSVLLKLHQQLNSVKYLYGNADAEKLVLHFNSKSNQFVCKSFDANTSHVSPAVFKSLNAPVKWQQLECVFEIDYLYHIKENEPTVGCNLKKRMTILLDTIFKALTGAKFLLNGEIRQADENLESLNKKKVQKKSQGSKEQNDESKPIQVAIFQSLSEDQKDFETFNAGGQIRLVGQIVSKVWVNPKSTVEIASNAVVQDIMRSLASRLDMHWDSLTEEEDSEDINTIHEPPRRVFIPISNTELTVSDYLFPGESSPDLLAPLKDLLGISSVNLKDVEDIEGQADLAQFNDVLENESETAVPKLSTDTNKFMYFIGLGVALFVLILSLFIHFFTK